MNIGEVPAGTPLQENPNVCQPGCGVRDDAGERTMSEESRYGTQQQKGKAGEGIATLGRKAAAIAMGSKQHWVCGPAREGSGREVEVCGATTPELHRMAAWLQERNVESVALESTGVYWIPVQEVLEEHGWEVWLVDTRELAWAPVRGIGGTVNGSSGCIIVGC